MHIEVVGVAVVADIPLVVLLPVEVVGEVERTVQAVAPVVAEVEVLQPVVAAEAEVLRPVVTAEVGVLRSAVAVAALPVVKPDLQLLIHTGYRILHLQHRCRIFDKTSLKPLP